MKISIGGGVAFCPACHGTMMNDDRRLFWDAGNPVTSIHGERAHSIMVCPDERCPKHDVRYKVYLPVVDAEEL